MVSDKVEANASSQHLQEAGAANSLVNDLRPADWKLASVQVESADKNQNPGNNLIDMKGLGERTAQVLADSKTSAQDKFNALEKFAKAGGNDFEFTDKDGTLRKLRIDYEQFESKSLIHVYANEQGKERIVLRAVCNPDGTYSLERDSRDKPLSFYGTWWAEHQVGKSYFAPSGDLSADLSPDSPELNALFDQVAKSASGKTNRMEKLSNGVVYFRAGMMIDADGSPRAKELDPKNGQLDTSLRYPDGSSVNAEVMRYYVLPGGKYQKFNIDKSDLAAVRYKGLVYFPVFADVGPPNKIGEGSMALADGLHIPNSPINGGISDPDVEYIVFPSSGDKTPGSNETNTIKGLGDIRQYAERSKNKKK